jgi:hypothetical protein
MKFSKYILFSTILCTIDLLKFIVSEVSNLKSSIFLVFSFTVKGIKFNLRLVQVQIYNVTMIKDNFVVQANLTHVVIKRY